jgi:hypothetical protein
MNNKLKKELATMKSPKGVTVIVVVETGKTIVLGTNDPWADMAYQLEGLALTCQKCVDRGMAVKEVYGELQNYFNKISISGGYKIIKSEKF